MIFWWKIWGSRQLFMICKLLFWTGHVAFFFFWNFICKFMSRHKMSPTLVWKWQPFVFIISTGRMLMKRVAYFPHCASSAHCLQASPACSAGLLGITADRCNLLGTFPDSSHCWSSSKPSLKRIYSFTVKKFQWRVRPIMNIKGTSA